MDTPFDTLVQYDGTTEAPYSALLDPETRVEV